MSQNVFDNLVVLEATEGLVVFRDFATGIDGLYFFFYPASPNGIVPAPQGSISSGPGGAFINIDGATGWAPIGGASGVSLQEAYDFVPSGSITLSGVGGPLTVTNPIGAPQTALVVTQNAPGQLAADFSGPVRSASTVTTSSLFVEDPMAGTGIFFDSADGQTAPVSGPGHGRLRYNDATKMWQMSVDGAAYVNVGTGTDAYAPAVAADWAPPPTTKAGALDEIVRNGAGHFRKSRDPLLTPAPIIYVRTTGNDSTGDGTLGAPFLTIARAVQSIPVNPEWNNTYPTIDLGAGVFKLPQEGGYGNITFQGTVTTTVSYVVDASQPTNTQATGFRVVLDTLAVAPAAGTRVTIGGGVGDALIYRSDNSGAGGRAVIWVVPTLATGIVTPAVGASVDVLNLATFLNTMNYTIIEGGYFNDCRFASLGGGLTLMITQRVDFTRCNFSDIQVYAWGEGILLTQPYMTHYGMINDNSVIEVAAGVFETYGGSGPSVAVAASSGVLDFQGEIALGSSGAGVGIIVQGGQIINGPLATYRIYQGIDLVLSANQLAINGTSVGGSYDLGAILQPQTVAGAQIAGFTGTYLVDVGPDASVRVRLDAASSIVVGGVTNPVAIDTLPASADGSGTYITGGYPKPGANGPSRQDVAVTATTWDGLAQIVKLDSSAIGPGGTFLLPACASVSDNVKVWIKNDDGVNTVTITPNGADTIDGAASLALGAAGARSACLLVNDRVAGNWMIF